MQKMVFDAFTMQKARGQVALNGKLEEKDIDIVCRLDGECLKLLHQASERYALSHRAQNKVKKLARTIADLAKTKEINKSHILEALSYRRI